MVIGICNRLLTLQSLSIYTYNPPFISKPGSITPFIICITIGLRIDSRTFYRCAIDGTNGTN